MPTLYTGRLCLFETHKGTRIAATLPMQLQKVVKKPEFHEGFVLTRDGYRDDGRIVRWGGPLLKNGPDDSNDESR